MDVRFEVLLKVWTQHDLAIHSGLENLPCQDQVFTHEHKGHLGARRHAVGGLRVHEAAQLVEEATHDDREGRCIVYHHAIRHEVARPRHLHVVHVF
jgi:hypothetical protein